MNDRYSVIYNEEARKDIKEIYAYIAFKLMVPITAEDQINRIRTLIHSLDCMPSRYPIVEWEPWKSYGMHRAQVNHYVVYYEVDDSQMEVIIIRIFYDGQDVEGITSHISTDN